MISETQLTIAKQINAKELKFARFNLMTDKDNIIIVGKGKRAVKIEYVFGSDTYKVELIILKGIKREVETLNNVYFDDLQNIIQNHFPRFEYVMEQFMRC